MGEQSVTNRNEKAQKVLKDSGRLIVWHNPDSKPWEERIRRRFKNGSSCGRMLRHTHEACSIQSMSKGIPAAGQICVCIQHHAEHRNIAFLQADGKIFQQLLDIPLWLYLVELF